METILILVAVCVVIAAVIWAVVRYMFFYRHEHLECPSCKYHWKPPILKMIFAVNAVEGKIIRCPHCGNKDYMEPVRDKRQSKK